MYCLGVRQATRLILLRWPVTFCRERKTVSKSTGERQCQMFSGNATKNLRRRVWSTLQLTLPNFPIPFPSWFITILAVRNRSDLPALFQNLSSRLGLNQLCSKEVYINFFNKHLSIATLFRPTDSFKSKNRISLYSVFTKEWRSFKS